MIFSFQELDLTSGALLLGETPRAAVWEEMILSHLNSKDENSKYSLIHSKQLVGMLLCIFVKSDHTPHVTKFQSTVAGCGIMGMMVCFFFLFFVGIMFRCLFMCNMFQRETKEVLLFVLKYMILLYVL